MKYIILLIFFICCLSAETLPRWFYVLHGSMDTTYTGVVKPEVTLRANITVMFKPLSLKSTKLIYNNDQVGIWTVAIKNNSIYNLTINRNDIMIEVPDIVDFPNNLAQDILTRDANKSFWSIASKTLTEMLNLGGPALTATGLATNSKSLGYWGLSASVLTYFIGRATTRSPNPNPYFNMLMPDIIILNSERSSSTYFLVAALHHNVQSITISMDVSAI
jgi:hypothetical protein